jgi:hypothetical protein
MLHPDRGVYKDEHGLIALRPHTSPRGNGQVGHGASRGGWPPLRRVELDFPLKESPHKLRWVRDSRGLNHGLPHRFVDFNCNAHDLNFTVCVPAPPAFGSG